MKIIFLIFLVFGLVMNIWTFAVADEETTLVSNSEQSTKEPSNVTLTTKQVTTVKSSLEKSPIKLPFDGNEGKFKEKIQRESEDCEQQLLIYDEKIADLEIKLEAYLNQKKALKSVMKIVLELLMNEVSLGTDDDLDKKS